MKFDKGDRTFDKELFEYVEDPTIESAESGVAGQVSCNAAIQFMVLQLLRCEELIAVVMFQRLGDERD
jgi:hypothetical protein